MADTKDAPEPVFHDPQVLRDNWETEKAAADAAQAKAEPAPSADVANVATPEPEAPVTTGDASGVPAEQAFGGLIDAAKFTLRESGHTHIVDLLDGLYAGLLRLEAAIGG